MSYLLDTSTCIQISATSPSAVLGKFRFALAQSPVYISSIVLYELFYGVYKSIRLMDSQTRLQALLSKGLVPLPFESRDAEAAGRIRAFLESRKQPIGHYDTLIAGQALARGLTLVTTNSREFARVDGLLWEDWSLPTP